MIFSMLIVTRFRLFMIADVSSHHKIIVCKYVFYLHKKFLFCLFILMMKSKFQIIFQLNNK